MDTNTEPEAIDAMSASPAKPTARHDRIQQDRTAQSIGYQSVDPLRSTDRYRLSAPVLSTDGSGSIASDTTTAERVLRTPSATAPRS